jgi:hypothetical protein
MINYIVNIAVDPPGVIPSGGSVGNFVYTPALLRVLPGDTIQWTCDHPFVLSFKGSTPVDQVECVGLPDGLTWATDQYPVSHVRGQYHYAVALWDGVRLFLDADCGGVSVN